MDQRGDSYRVALVGTGKNGTSKPSDYSIASQAVPISKPAKKKLAKTAEQELEMDEHQITIDELCNRLETRIEYGMSSNQAQIRLERDGLNELTPAKAVPAWIQFVMNLFADSFLSILLLIIVVICFVNYVIIATSYEIAHRDDLYLGISLLVAIFVLAFFSFYHKSKSDEILYTIKSLLPQQALVLRDGKKMLLDSSKLVVGDVIEVKYGDVIPADLRLVKCSSLKVDNSSMTGESNPQTRSTEYTHENPLETQNLAFRTANVVEGTATGIVVNTGDRTVFGRISNLVSDMEIHDVPLSKELTRLTGITTVTGILLGIIFFIVTLHLGYQWMESIVIFIGLVVACAPVGLQPTITLCLTLMAKRMAKKNCLIRNLNAIETLGCITTVCTDKTGTLTFNRMAVAHIWMDACITSVDRSVYESQMDDPNSASWFYLARAAAICNNAEFKSDQENVTISRSVCFGDASDAALLRCVRLINGDVETYRMKHPKVYEIPFNSANKYHVTVHKTQDGDSRFLMIMKGAPERIFQRCSTILINGKEEKIDSNIKEEFAAACLELGCLGERLLGFCDTRLSELEFPRECDFTTETRKLPSKGMRFLGILSMVDPLRAGVRDAVMKCRAAGIRVIMFTGDHPETAKAVARYVGIFSDGNKTIEDVAAERGIPIHEVNPREVNALVIHGNDLQKMSSDELSRILRDHSELIFARTTPHQKLKIVDCLQQQGALVAVTGQAVHDCAALKKADIGVAMGIVGSDVSRTAADVILLDDNFTSLVAGIEEGRLAFDNLKKSVAYILASNIPEIIPFFMFIILDVPLPLGTIAILCVDVGTDLLPAISLVYEEVESDVMKRRPRNPIRDRLLNERIFSMSYAQIGIIETAAGIFSYLVVMTENGFWPARLIGLRREWDSMAVNDLMDSYGQEWSFYQRKRLDYTCYAAFFVALVIVQWASLLAYKTRRNSVFHQGLWNNQLTFSLFFETALAAFLVYCPAINYGLHLQPLRFTWWLAPMPFAFLILFYDEVRKFLLRQSSHGSWIEQETYY